MLFRKSHYWLAVMGLAGCVPTPSQPPYTADLLIRDVVIVSPESGQGTAPQDVLIDDGIILQIGDLDGAAADRVIAGGGRILTPGLIDSHTHLFGVPGMTFEDNQAFPEITREAKAQIPRSYLYYGFTTVIDLHSGPDVIGAWNASAVRPQAYFCGAAPIMGGYPMRFLPAPLSYQLTPYFLLGDNDPPEGIDPQQHTPRAVVDRMRADGAICVKTHHESGFGGGGYGPVPGVDLIADLVDAAHAQDMPVLLHANNQAAQAFGVAAGVDAFAHGIWTWDQRTETVPSEEVLDLYDQIAQSDIYVQPTIQVLYGERDLHDPDYLENPDLRHVLPASLIAWHASSEGQATRRSRAEMPYFSSILSEQGWQALGAVPIKRVTDYLRYLDQNCSGNLLFGSDTPSDLTFANPPGLNGRTEMDRWVTAGVSPARIFTAATKNNADFFGLSDRIGSVEVGKQADLLLMDLSPLDTVDAYDTISAVMVAGEVHERCMLSAQGACEGH